MLFNLGFANNTILSCFFFFFLIIDSYILILEVVAQICNPIAEFVIPIGIPSKEAITEIKIHPVIEEAKIRKYLISFRVVQMFVLSTHQFFLLSFFKEIISRFIYFV